MTMKPRKVYSLSDTFVTLVNQEEDNRSSSYSPQQQLRHPNNNLSNSNNSPYSSQSQLINSPEFQRLFHPSSNLVHTTSSTITNVNKELAAQVENQKGKNLFWFMFQNNREPKSWLVSNPKLNLVRKEGEEASTTTTTDEENNCCESQACGNNNSSNNNNSRRRTRFSKWSSRVKREENKLLRRLFRHFSHGDEVKNNELNINGDYYYCDNKTVTTVTDNIDNQVVVVVEEQERKPDNNINSDTKRQVVVSKSNNDIPINKGLQLWEQEDRLSFSENEKCFGSLQQFQLSDELVTRPDDPVSKSLPSESNFVWRENYNIRRSSNSVVVSAGSVSTVMDDLSPSGAGQSGAVLDKTVQSADDETSSSYSTAEEDQAPYESDLEGQSVYGTPKTSISTSRFSLRSTGRRSSRRRRKNSSGEFASALDLKSEDSDNKNELTEGELSSSLHNISFKSDDDSAFLSEIKMRSNLEKSVSEEDEAAPSAERPLRRKSKIEMLLTENQPIGFKELQAVFDCFKEEDISRSDCDTLLESLGVAQKREDFQWALHQLGGFNALLILYARVVEISSDDGVQSKSLSLVLNQLRNHYRLTDGPAQRQYHLIRFVLNSEKSTYGFKTFIHLMNFCLSASGLKLVDYQLMETCLLSSWRQLTRVRCKESDAPTGPKSLFECLLTIMLDLLEEQNIHRELNVALLKANRFSETLLAICYHAIMDESTTLHLMDGLRLASLVKSILSELMAPPDAYVAVTLLKFGLLPLLPKELPPLPRKDDAFFMFHKAATSPSHSSLRTVREAEEADERDRVGRADQSDNEGAESDQESQSGRSVRSVRMEEEEEDVPEIIGIQNNDTLPDFQMGSGRSSPNGSSGFSQAFQESLLEGVMSILLNALSILPDNAFHSVLSPHMSSHLFVAYCSHPGTVIKKLSLKLLSAWLTRAKSPVVVDFLKSKGFYLTSLYIQGDPDLAPLILNICQGFGPLSYPLVVALLYSNQVVNTVMEWSHNNETGVIPALLQMGLLPSIFNIQAHQVPPTPMPKPLQNLLSMVTRFCAIHPKDDPWKSLFVPSLECGYGNSALVPRLVMEATEFLRRYKKKDLKKVDASNRLLWLIERGSATRLGHHFDKWLLNIFTLHIMEMDEEDELEHWIYFVKKNKKKLNHLMGTFLCRIFASNRDNLDFKHYTVRILLTFCPTLLSWLPKVIKCDEKIERCFTAFVRIFLNHAEQKCMKLDSHLRTPSFHSLISDNGNLTLTLQMAGLSQGRRHSTANNNNADERFETESDPGTSQMSDSALRAKFENVLVDSGILSPTSNFSMFSADFRQFKLLLETPTSGVSASEIRLCLTMVEKLRAPYLLGMNRHAVAGGKETIVNAAYFEGVYSAVNSYAMDMLVNVARARTQQEVEVARRICLQDEDVFTVKQWCNVLEQMVHPKAPWHFPDSYSTFWALDQSEGPGRVRSRLKREHLRVHNRFVLPKYRKSTQSSQQPLEYLFLSHSAQVLKHPLILNEIQYMRFCTRIIPGEELQGEIILTSEKLTFIAENAHYQSENVEVRKTAIKYLMKRRYTLEDRAVEIFLECRSFLFVFKTKKDREEFVSLLGLKHTGGNGQIQFQCPNATLMETSITSMTSQWLKGQLSNFEYLMYLNTWAGRTYCDLMQYPVFPFVLSKYDSPTLDLSAPQSYRDLKKPMAIQDISKEEHFVSTYNYLQRECDSAPFHYGSHYSNSGIVLHFLVRLPPYTQHFLKYQDGSFDIPDRSFHSVETTWRLASRESNTDFKEAIPEFFYLPEFLQNLQHFDLGVRQNGLRVDDVVLPPWAKGDARLFTLVNRQALESNHVRKYLCDWIDLIFGYKQTGKAALQAVNVFHPSTYEGFEVEASGDELLIRARKAMVSTYGQTPKQLFFYPHPRPSTVSVETCDLEVLDTVWGIRWGNYIGSPSCHDLDVIHTREYSETVSLFETNTRVVFWPENTVIIGDNVVGYWNSNSVRIKTKVVYNSIGDDITVCRGTTNSVWVGHSSGRISVLKLSPDSEKVLMKTELVGHYKPIRKIDVNQEFSVAISCSGENYAIMWDINKYPKIALINSIECSESIDDIHSSRSTGDIVVFNKEYNRVTLATINGFIVGSFEPEEQVDSVCLSSLDPGRNVNVIALGCDYGVIRFYSTWDLKFVNQIKVLPLSSLSIKCIRYSRDGRRLYCMSETEEGAVTVALQLSYNSKRH